MIRKNPETFAAYYMINVRTHYIDAALERAAAAGVTQVVVLGAGFDSRAYRFRVSHPTLRFFEVDLPATSDDKQRRLAALAVLVSEWPRLQRASGKSSVVAANDFFRTLEHPFWNFITHLPLKRHRERWR